MMANESTFYGIKDVYRKTEDISYQTLPRSYLSPSRATHYWWISRLFQKRLCRLAEMSNTVVYTRNNVDLIPIALLQTHLIEIIYGNETILLKEKAFECIVCHILPFLSGLSVLSKLYHMVAISIHLCSRYASKYISQPTSTHAMWYIFSTYVGDTYIPRDVWVSHTWLPRRCNYVYFLKLNFGTDTT